MKESIKVILVEDSPEYREVIALAIGRESNIELVQTLGTAEVALRYLQGLVPSAMPDVVLLDLNLPGMSGLETIPWIQKYSPEAKIIMLTQSNKEADVIQAIALGASGYLLKQSTLSQIMDGLRSVQSGNALLDGDVARYITSALKTKSAELKLERPLSEREMEILVLLGEGLVKKEIAKELGIGFSTVASHIRHIYEKLQVENAPAAISKAYKSGVLE
ncbi:response regulator [Rubritalea spongiae]|uniref:Response regulator n=1 Tax=Rubritalea spongiae TaxID=430797 RepID=A0ABW5E2M1_9BACT